jgi:hypothetical protein
MLYKSTLLAEASGSVDGLVFSHNRGGRYVRRRQIPTNPNSSAQQNIRALFSDAMARWRDVLTAAQRAAWKLYADNTPIVNALGDTIYLTGPQHFVRSAVVSVAYKSIWPDDGPTTYGLPSLSPCSIAAVAPAATIALSFDNTDAWASQADARLCFFLGEPQNATINFFKGPFRYQDGVQGNAVPPVSPKNLANGLWVVTAGQHVFARVVVSDEEGRLSVEQVLVCTAS